MKIYIQCLSEWFLHGKKKTDTRYAWWATTRGGSIESSEQIMAYDQQAPYPLMVKFMDEYVGTNYLTKSANREFKWL
jgi:hypothetical protein